MAEQRRKLLEQRRKLLGRAATQQKRSHIKHAEAARQRALISQKPERTDAEQIEKPRKRTPKSTGHDDQDFVVGFTTAAAAAATSGTHNERDAIVCVNQLMTDIDFQLLVLVKHPHPSPEGERKCEHIGIVDSNFVSMQLLTFLDFVGWIFISCRSPCFPRFHKGRIRQFYAISAGWGKPWATSYQNGIRVGSGWWGMHESTPARGSKTIAQVSNNIKQTSVEPLARTNSKTSKTVKRFPKCSLLFACM